MYQNQHITLHPSMMCHRRAHDISCIPFLISIPEYWQKFQTFIQSMTFLESLATKWRNLVWFCMRIVLFGSSQYAFSKFLESYISEFWRFRNNILETYLTQNYLYIFIYFGLNLKLAPTTHKSSFANASKYN